MSYKITCSYVPLTINLRLNPQITQDKICRDISDYDSIPTCNEYVFV